MQDAQAAPVLVGAQRATCRCRLSLWRNCADRLVIVCRWSTRVTRARVDADDQSKPAAPYRFSCIA